MCGITAIISKNKKKVDSGLLSSMSDCLSHRGPDGNGIYAVGSVGLAHQRLAIYDVSEAASQPMERHSLVCSFNGAIYNFIEIRDVLEQQGYTFSSISDTEVLLAAYDHYGPDCFSMFNGQWAIVIYDKAENSIIIARDRYGIKPLYYYETQEYLFISSEIKGFFVIPGFKADVNKRQALAFLKHGMHDFNSETFFKNIYSFDRATYVNINVETQYRDVVEYYSIGSKAHDYSDPMHSYRSLLLESVRLRQRTDVPYAFTLSGGLDSSSIVACAVEKEDNVTTYSISYDESLKTSETAYIDAVKSKLKVANSKLNPDYNTLMSELDACLYHQEQPFDGLGVLAQYYIYKNMSQDGFKVSLGGQGADELLAGYNKFYLGLWKSSGFVSKMKLIIQFIRLYGFNRTEFINQFRAFKKKQSKKQDNYIKIKDSLFNYSEANDSIQNISHNLLSKMGIASLLRYEDRNAMAHGIESRLPFLDFRLVDYTYKLDDQFKIKEGVKKYVLRESMRDLLPEIVVNRIDKLGYYVPEGKEKQKKHMLSYIISHQDTIDQYIDIASLNESLTYRQLWRIFIFHKWLNKFIYKEME